MKLINYILIFHFSLGAFIPKYDFSQLLKLNALLEHYALHQREALDLGEEINFTEFLYVHFIEGDEHEHKNENEHSNLPFQSYASASNLVVCAVIALVNIPPDHQVSPLPLYTLTYSIEFLSGIFHPPSFA